MGKKSGFTLAEILITLTIIGVVAALAVPAMIQDTQDKQFRTAWKKAFAELSQAYKLVVYESGGTIKNRCTSTKSNECIRDLLGNYFRYIKTCDHGQSFGNCWHNDGTWRFLNGNYVSTGYGNNASAISGRGNLLRFTFAYQCNDVSETTDTILTCGVMKIDINGFNGPNMYGKDIYMVHFFETELKPLGISGDDYNPATDCTKNGTGRGCSALYLYQ